MCAQVSLEFQLVFLEGVLFLQLIFDLLPLAENEDDEHGNNVQHKHALEEHAESRVEFDIDLVGCVLDGVPVVLVDALGLVLELADEDDAAVLSQTGDVEGDAGIVELGIFLDHHDPAEVERDLLDGVDREEGHQEHLLIRDLVGEDELDGFEHYTECERLNTLELVEDVSEDHEEDLEFECVQRDQDARLSI